MGKHNRTLANRLLVLLAENGGTVSHQRVHDLPMSKAEIAQAIADTSDLVTVTNPYFGKTRHRRKVYTLTELGHARAYTLKANYHPTRLTIPDWQAQLSEMIAGREPEGLQIALDRQDGPKWRAHEAARKAKDRAQEAKRAAKEKPTPKYPSAGRNRSQADLEARRQWTRSKGFTPRDSDDEDETEDQAPAPKQIPVEFNRGRYHVAPTPPPQYNIPVTPATPAKPVLPAPAAPTDDFTAAYNKMQRDLSTIHEPNREFSNLPNPADVADNARIIELFTKTSHSGELLPNGRIRYDNQDMTPKQWERERFKQSG
jgi:DNA-binding PadR family transcriptional regulator